MNNKIKFETKAYEVKQLENGNIEFTAIATSFGNPDVVDDIIAEGALDKFLASGDMPKLLWGHDAGRPPIGKIKSLRVIGDEVIMTAEVFKENKFALDEIIPGMKEGVIDSVSIGFTYNFDEVDFNKGFRIFNEIALHEVSVVNFPANPKARITNVKSLDGLEFEVAEKGYNLSDDSIEKLEAFAKDKDFDIKSAYLDDACTIQFIDINEEKAVLVPCIAEKALLSVKGIIKEYEFKEEELEQVKYKIARAYKAMGKSNPFESQSKLSDTEVSLISNERELEKMLKSTGAFSNEAAKIIASNFKSVDRDDEQADNQRDVESQEEDKENGNQQQLEAEKAEKEAIDKFINSLK